MVTAYVMALLGILRVSRSFAFHAPVAFQLVGNRLVLKSQKAASSCSSSQRPQSPLSLSSLGVHNSIHRTVMSMSNIGEEKPMEVSKEDGIVRILCLHGKGNNGASFQSILEPLENDLNIKLALLPEKRKVEFTYLTAPFTMEDEGGTGTTMQGWTLPPGVRSFEAMEYGGFEESSKLVENALFEKDYKFVLGHSQGAILLSALISCDDWTNRIFSFDRTKTEIAREQPMGYVFNGNAWPNPYTEQVEAFTCKNVFASSGRTRRAPKALFVIGKRDNVNPPEGAERVREAFINGGIEVESCYHDGGHAVPVNDAAAADKIVDWIVDLVNSEPK
jgi:predicted esterase